MIVDGAKKITGPVPLIDTGPERTLTVLASYLVAHGCDSGAGG